MFSRKCAQLFIKFSFRLPNGHLNVAAFNRLAAIVGAFTQHMCDANNGTAPPTDDGEYADLCQHMQNCTLQNEKGRNSLLCEIPRNNNCFPLFKKNEMVLLYYLFICSTCTI